MRDKRNCLSHWFPLIEAAGLPVPKTRILKAPNEFWRLIDDQRVEGLNEFLEGLHAAALEVGGYPVFLRTGQGSGKHSWLDTCFVQSESDLLDHVYALCEWSECVDMMGLPYDVWVVRELLPTQPLMRAYRGMPVCREFRAFAKDGTVLCVHPYWPKGSLLEGLSYGELREGSSLLEEPERQFPADFPLKYNALCELSLADEAAIKELAERASAAVGGTWSVDLLDTERGWFLTDMAVAVESWHWPDCKMASAISS